MTPEQVANKVFRNVTGRDFPAKMRKADEVDKTIYFSALAAVQLYRELIINDMKKRSHPDDWGVSCIYVESYAKELKEEA